MTPYKNRCTFGLRISDRIKRAVILATVLNGVFFAAQPSLSSFIDTLVAAPPQAALESDSVGHQLHPLTLLSDYSNDTLLSANSMPSNDTSFATLEEVLDSHSQNPPSHNDLLYLSTLLEVSPKEAQNILRANWSHLQHYLVATPGGHGTSPTARRIRKKQQQPHTAVSSSSSAAAATTISPTTAAATMKILLSSHHSLIDSAAASSSKHVALLHADNSNNNDDSLVDDNDDDDGDGPVCRFSESTILGLAAEYGNQTSRMLRFLCLNTPDHYLHLLSFEWEYVGVFLSMTAFVFALALAKIIFHVTGLVHVIPDSCILILLGFMVGAMLKVFSLNHIVTLYVFFEGRAASVFFLLLLPPIILESAYSLYDREFAQWFATVMLFAVIGTLLNAFIVGPLLYVLNLCGAMGSVTLDLTFLGCMTFASLISAVDPVAVLALFSELGVNPALYFLVFGESLFNDAVTVVLFNTFHVLMFESEQITMLHMAIALAKFFLITSGGIVIGFAFGILTTLLVKYTEHCRVVEPLLFFVLAYASYLLSELFHFSGIIGLIACGLSQWHYATRNASTKSRTTVKYFSKMLASLAESAVFVGFGVLLIEEFAWHTGFICWTLFLITIVRFGVTFGLSAVANRVWLLRRKITYGEQFIMSYGGLRGAIAFALSVQLNPRIMGGYNYYHRYFGFDTNYELMVTTTTVVILFTVFVQGITLKPIIGCLNVREVSTATIEAQHMVGETTKAAPGSAAQQQQHATTRIFGELHRTMLDHVTSGMNAIIGFGALNDVLLDDSDPCRSKPGILERLQRFDSRHIKPWLLKKNHHRRQQQQQQQRESVKKRAESPSQQQEAHINEIIAAATAYYAASQQQQDEPSVFDHHQNPQLQQQHSIEHLWQAAARSKALLRKQRNHVPSYAPTTANGGATAALATGNVRDRLQQSDTEFIELENTSSSSGPEFRPRSSVRQIKPSLDNLNREIVYASKKPSDPALENAILQSVETSSKNPNRGGMDSGHAPINHYYSNLAFQDENNNAITEEDVSVATDAVAEQAGEQRWNFSAARSNPPRISAARTLSTTTTPSSSSSSMVAFNNVLRAALSRGNSGKPAMFNEAQLKTALSQSYDRIPHYKAARRFSVSRDGVQESSVDEDDDDDDEDGDESGLDNLDGNSILFTDGNSGGILPATGRKAAAAAAANNVILRRRRSSSSSINMAGALAIHRTLTLPIDVDVWRAKINKSLAAAAAVKNSKGFEQQNADTSQQVPPPPASATTSGRRSTANRLMSKRRNENIIAMRHIGGYNARRQRSVLQQQQQANIAEESVHSSSATTSPAVHRCMASASTLDGGNYVNTATLANAVDVEEGGVPKDKSSA